MNVEMVLNELSLKTPAANIIEARNWMSELIKTLQYATSKIGIKRVLRTQDDLNFIEIAPGYTVAKWRNDHQVDLEQRSFFRTLTAKAPVTIDVSPDIKNRFDLVEAFYQGETAVGLTFVLITNSISISLLSESRWDCSFLLIDIIEIDQTEKLVNKQLEIPHASRQLHLQQHQRKYVPSPKHSVGGWGTFMDLTDEISQIVLNQGMAHGRQIYGYYEQKYYEFQSDNAGGFHGYPIKDSEVPPRVMKYFSSQN